VRAHKLRHALVAAAFEAHRACQLTLGAGGGLKSGAPRKLPPFTY